MVGGGGWRQTDRQTEHLHSDIPLTNPWTLLKALAGSSRWASITRDVTLHLIDLYRNHEMGEREGSGQREHILFVRGGVAGKCSVRN